MSASLKKGARVEVHGLTGSVVSSKKAGVSILLDKPVYGGRGIFCSKGDVRLIADPEPCPIAAVRRAITAELRRMGFELEYRSGQGGSLYYAHRTARSKAGFAIKVRVSDHEVPATPERDHNRTVGRVGWNFDLIYTQDWQAEMERLKEFLADAAA